METINTWTGRSGCCGTFVTVQELSVGKTRLEICRFKDNIKMDVREMGCRSMYCFRIGIDGGFS
jgi:hypothetical protein